MRTDRAADGGDGEIIGIVFPKRFIICDIFFEQGIVQTAVGKRIRHGKIDTAAFGSLLPQHITAVF